MFNTSISLFCFNIMKVTVASLKSQTFLHGLLNITIHDLEVCFLKTVVKWT